MFLVDDILAAPGKAMLFLFRELAKKAKDDFLDDDTVKQQLQEIYALLDAGTISGQEFESREIQLLQRLEQIARIKSGEAETLALPAAENDLPTAELARDQDNLDRVMRWREQQHGAAPVIESAVAVAPLLPMTASAADPLPLPRVPPQPPAPEAALPSFAMPPSFAVPAPVAAPPPPSLGALPSFAAPAFAPPPLAPAPMPSLPSAATVAFDRQAVPVTGQLTMSQVIDSVFRTLATLKLKVSSVTSVSRDEGGWRVTAEVVERRAVPDSGDLLGIYDLRLDEGGGILRYERTRMRRRSDLGR
jgi:hypothetical protein